jgi:hypothetical protein
VWEGHALGGTGEHGADVEADGQGFADADLPEEVDRPEIKAVAPCTVYDKERQWPALD